MEVGLPLSQPVRLTAPLTRGAFGRMEFKEGAFGRMEVGGIAAPVCALVRNDVVFDG